jgi:hypothetical protein
MLAYVLIGILLIALLWIVRVREGFINPDPTQNMHDPTQTMPDPREIIVKLRGILDNVDNKDFLNQIIDKKNKDPGSLARDFLGIRNDDA